MKKLILSLTALAALFLAPLGVAEMHKFTSADGSKQIVAKIVTVDPAKGLVALLLETGNQIHAPITAFSEEDQEYIQTVGKAKNIGRMLAVRFSDEEKQVSEKKNPVNGYQTLQLKSGFALEIRNNSPEEVKGLEADYQIFYKAYLNPFESRERTEQVANGKLTIPAMASRKEVTVNTAEIPMTRIKQLPKAECVGGT